MAFDVIWGPLSEQGQQDRLSRVLFEEFDSSGVISSVRPSAARARSKMTRTWVEVSSIDTSVSTQRRLTTSTIANAARRARGKWVTSQHQILLGSHAKPVGPQHPRRRVPRRRFGQNQPLSSQNTAQRRRRHPHPALVGAPVRELAAAAVHGPPLLADVEDLGDL